MAHPEVPPIAESFSGGRYVVVSDDPTLTPFDDGVRDGRALAAAGHWAAKYNTPENICTGCGHCRNSHLDQPEVKGGPPNSDRGWTTRSEGSCIWQGCPCKTFVEPTDAQIAAASVLAD